MHKFKLKSKIPKFKIFKLNKKTILQKNKNLNMNLRYFKIHIHLKICINNFKRFRLGS